MTGFSSASAELPLGSLQIEMRSVNSRFLDIQFRIPDEMRAMEPLLRELISSRVARGKVELRMQINTRAAAPRSAALNAEALAGLRRLADGARAAIPDARPMSVVEVLRWPGVLAEEPVDEERVNASAAECAKRAVEDLCASRTREGAKLKEALLARVADMRKRAAEAVPLVPEAVAAQRARMTERLRELLGAADEERLRQEIAVLALKADVDEELTRFNTHLDEVARVLDKGGAAGKRLDFLAQELNREANTLASKAVSAKLADCALELKLLVEQVREQVQNIE
jgi:uncharacterized protein (TIGR00255 family)